MKKPTWLYGDKPVKVEKTVLQKWLTMDWKQWVQWVCSILTFVLAMVTIILPIAFIAIICMEGWDNSPLDGFVSRIFTPYIY